MIHFNVIFFLRLRHLQLFFLPSSMPLFGYLVLSINMCVRTWNMFSNWKWARKSAIAIVNLLEGERSCAAIYSGGKGEKWENPSRDRGIQSCRCSGGQKKVMKYRWLLNGSKLPLRPINYRLTISQVPMGHSILPLRAHKEVCGRKRVSKSLSTYNVSLEWTGIHEKNAQISQLTDSTRKAIKSRALEMNFFFFSSREFKNDD